MAKTRHAVIGAGGIAGAHLKAIRKLEDRADLVAIADVSDESLKRRAGEFGPCATYADHRELLAQEKPDIVHICTPPGMHADMCVESMEAGAWVLCEKPIVGSLAEFDRVRAAEGDGGPYASSVFQWRFGCAVQRLKQQIQEGILGRRLLGQCETTWYRGPKYYDVPWRGKWDTELGGPTVGHGIHAMDTFLWLMGDWQEVQCIMANLDRDVETEDVAVAAVRFSSGALGYVVNSVLSPHEISRVRISFQKATVTSPPEGLYSPGKEPWTYRVLGGTDLEGKEAELAGEGDPESASHHYQIRALIEDFHARRRPLVSGPEARRAIDFITALYKSAITGQAVRGTIDENDPFYQAFHGGKPHGIPK